jgi:hypothetical protein
MNPHSQNILQEILDRIEIEALLCKYMRSLDRMLFDELREIFHDDSVVDVGGLFKGTGAQYAVHASNFLSACESTHHQLGQMSIRLEGHKAYGESYFTAYHKVTKDGISNDLIVAGRYKDRYENRGQGWRIASRIVITDWSSTRLTSQAFMDDPRVITGSRGQVG